MTVLSHFLVFIWTETYDISTHRSDGFIQLSVKKYIYNQVLGRCIGHMKIPYTYKGNTSITLTKVYRCFSLYIITELSTFLPSRIIQAKNTAKNKEQKTKVTGKRGRPRTKVNADYPVKFTDLVLRAIRVLANHKTPSLKAVKK